MDLIKTSFSSNLKSWKSQAGLFLATGATYFLVRKWNHYRNEKKHEIERPRRMLIIVGSDTGLGLSMAHWAAAMGYQVIAGCLNPGGEGSTFLKTTYGNLTVIKVDVRSDESVESFRDECERILNASEDNIKLWGIIYNAAIMILGEFLWQTKNMSESLMDVNYWGALRMTTAFKKMMFQQKCRLIFTSSDCSLYSLPTLSTYCASKAALQSWAKSLRLELAKYGVTVACHDPGSFAQQSQIMAQVPRQLEEMEAAMSKEDREFYGNFIAELRDTKVQFNTTLPKTVKPFNNMRLERSLKFLLEGDITKSIVHSSATFEILQFIRDYLPVKLGDQLLNKCLYLSAFWTPRQY